MTDQKIYPLNPIFETTTRDGRKAWVAFYNNDHDFCWLGSDENGVCTWQIGGRYTYADPHVCDLTSVPPIPPEAREPQPGEVWEMTNGLEIYLIKRPGAPGGVWEGWTAAFGAGTVDRSTLARKWPADKPHGFEPLIDAILQAHGGKL